MPKSYVIDFEVTGCGDLPDDMLRYDRAEVVTLKDLGTQRFGQTNYEGIMRIRSTSAKTRPTRDRWASFGWSVGKVDAQLVT